MNEFLQSTDVIDWHHPAVRAKAAALRAGAAGCRRPIARRCFEWVRDEIQHTTDFGLEVVTCAASDVLEQGSGFCYAKSHLLAALLRANGIPAGFCYQRLALDDDGRQFCLHGFNGMLLPGVGWYRADPRGNRAGIDAQFVPPVECLAFEARFPARLTRRTSGSDPLPAVVEALRAHDQASILAQHLPDVALDRLSGTPGALSAKGAQVRWEMNQTAGAVAETMHAINQAWLEQRVDDMAPALRPRDRDGVSRLLGTDAGARAVARRVSATSSRARRSTNSTTAANRSTSSAIPR